MSFTHRRSLLIAAALLTGTLLSPWSISAQLSTPSDSAAVTLRTVTTTAIVPATTPASNAGPRLATGGVNVDRTPTPFVVGQPAPDQHMGAGSNLALMGVGAAGVVVGLLIGGNGGDAIAIGGGVLGLLGLYRYLR